MEVSLTVSLEPAYKTGLYAVDVHAVWEEYGKPVATRSLLYNVIEWEEPTEDTDVRVWAIELVKAAAEITELDLTMKMERGTAVLRVTDFKPIDS